MATSLSSRSAPVQAVREQLDELDALLQRMLELPVSKAEEVAAADSPFPRLDRKTTIPSPVDAQEASGTIPIAGRDAEVFPGRASANELPGMPRPVPERAEQVNLEPRLISDPPREDERRPSKDEREEGREDWVPLRSSWQPSSQTWGPLAKQWQEAQQVEKSGGKYGKQAQPVPEPDEIARPAAAATSPPAQKPGSEETVPAKQKPLPTSWQMDAHAAAEPAAQAPPLKDILPLRPPEPTLTPPAEQQRGTSDEPPLPPFLWPLAAIDFAFDRLLLLAGPIGKPLRSRRGKSFLGIAGLLCLGAAAVLWALDSFNWTW